MLTRDAIHTLYDAGPEAVLNLLERLCEQIAQQQAQITQQQTQIAQLTERVSQLEEQLAANSRNSSKPPSSDGPGPRTRSLRPSSGKKPGAQIGHPGTTLTQVVTPARIVCHSPTACPGCGATLNHVRGTEQAVRRQVFDLPPLQLAVTEHRLVSKQCPACGTTTTGEFPATVRNHVQYGAGVKALAVCLNQEQLLPVRRTCQVLGDLFGQPLAEGTVPSALTECATELREIESQIKHAITSAVVAHFDETGCYVAGHRDWLHVASTTTLTHYAVHPKRGAAATTEIGILPVFTGRAVHDAWAAYAQFDCAHALCNAHHLRELTFLDEVTGREWAGAFKELLCTIKQAVEDTRAAGALHLPTSQRTAFEATYDQLLKVGLAHEAEQPPLPTGKRGRKKQSKAKNLLDRLERQRREVLAFMDDFAVPFDHNLAERDLRMVKVQQKISGTFRTRDGAQNFCRIRGYISTLKKQGRHVLSALSSLLSGLPVTPALDG
jgi:transposase